ncbi:alpha-1,3-mannosyltransferase, putative [Leishmania tarentolae]|uniref:dolichyl-P-Man:Man5GlcNAc2-PP-dolichol alpha-1,3-mannosyltransferase n=1 Tax=Leishmania tarentolae TaxID=5689 RepID=A0A640KUK7_LEITA|nr:alpha-1,3-mannosyltransferase, putative [Leishmania tarentolae]
MKLVSVALAAEAVVILAVILTMPYTEINWKAYMEGVEGFLAGDVDYRNLKNGTGPLVYPGGFVWVYSVLYYLTKKGEAVELAQWLHAGVYLVTLTMVLRLYTSSGLTWKTIIPLFVSKRIRSLYVLQLSSDCWAMLFLFAAVSFIAGRPSRAVTRSRQWFIGCLCYSFAVSIKMDILLFAPGMLYVMLRTLPFWRVVWNLFVCAALQVAVSLPFLVYDYRAYLAKSVKLDCGLIEQWPVNYRFLDADLVRRPEFGQALFAMTVATWILLWRTRWAARTYLTDSEAQVLHPAIEETRRQSTLSRGRAHGDEAVDDEAQEQAVYASTLLTFFEANLVGVIFARSIHYQFYTRFFYTVPLVLAYTKFPRVLRLMSFALIRQGFESFPPTPNTSMMLQGGFALALFALLFLGRDAPEAAKREAKDTARDNAPNLPHAQVTGNAAGKKKIQ